MTVAGASPWLDDESTVPRLVQVVIEPDGATMSCFYCRHTAPILAAEVAGQIQQFQESHFGCDATVAAWTTTPVEGTVPRQAGTDLT